MAGRQAPRAYTAGLAGLRGFAGVRLAARRGDQAAAVLVAGQAHDPQLHLGLCARCSQRKGFQKGSPELKTQRSPTEGPVPQCGGEEQRPRGVTHSPEAAPACQLATRLSRADSSCLLPYTREEEERAGTRPLQGQGRR